MQRQSIQKEKSRSVVGLGGFWHIDRLEGVYGEYFTKLDRRFATWGVDDGRGFDLAGDWYLCSVLWPWGRCYRLGISQGCKGLEGRTEVKGDALKYVAVLLLGAAFFIGGYQYAAALYGEDIAALREDYASRSQALEEKYREKERVQHQSLVEAWEERDKALARVSSLSDDVERVRQQAADAKRRLSAAGAGTCDAERKQLARCAELLERGTELVRRGVELSERTAIDKDAMAMIVSQ